MATKNKKSNTDKKLISENLLITGLNDRYSTSPGKGLTPTKLATLLQEADSGNVARQAELFHEMLRKGGHLSSLARGKTKRITRKNYEITTESTDPLDLKIRDEAAKMISKVKGWKKFIGHIMDAQLKGFVVIQNVWKEIDGRIDFVGFKWLHQKNFRFGKTSDTVKDLNDLRLLLDSSSTGKFSEIIPADILKNASKDGISLEYNSLLRKHFTVGIASDLSGFPTDSAVLRTIVYSFLFLNYDIKWWIQFAEKLLGYRIGKYDPNEQDQKAILKEIVQGLANDAAAVISKNSEIEFVEALQKAASAQSYKDIKDYFEADMTKAILLHESANQSTPGKLGSEDTVNDTLQLITEDDGSFVDETVCDDILRVWTEMNFGVREFYPTYKTQVEKETDLLNHAKLLESLQKIGYKISKKYAEGKFGVPSPNPNDPDDEALEPIQNANPFIPASSNVVAASKKKLLTNRRK